MAAKNSGAELFEGNRGLLVSLIAWSLLWKGLSLWRAAQDDSKPWFVALFITNTLGVLDSIYIFGVSRRRHRSNRDAITGVSG